MTTAEQIEAIEKEIRETPYHKGTEHHIGKLRARLARLKDQEIESDSRKGGGGRGGYAVKKQGDSTIVLAGPPSVGKSTLINKLTNAQSRVAPYAFTTVSVIPGMMVYKDARIQILDVPGLIKGAEEGKGRGREVLSVARGSDLLVIMTDVKDLKALDRIETTLEKNGIRINKVKPNVVIEKKAEGGIIVHSNIKQDISEGVIKEVAQEFRIRNGEITIKEKLTFDTLIDSFSANRVYIPAIYVINKVDLSSNNLHPTSYNQHPIPISAERDQGLEDFKEKIWETLKFLRVYLVGDDDKPTFDNPIVMKEGQTLKEVAQKIGTDFSESKEAAKIWGNGSKFPGQEVSLKTKVADSMQIRFI
jgi:uncharacterized protein